MTPSVIHELNKNVLETGAGLGRSLQSFLLLPFNLTYHTANFRGAGGIGLAPLALGPFGLIAAWRHSFARGLAAFAALLMAAWFVTAQVSRYLIPVYVIGAIFAVLGWRYVVRVSPRYGAALSAVAVALSISYGLIMIVPGRAADMHAAVSRTFETTRLRRQTPFLDSIEYLNREPSATKVLILNPYVAGYYFDKPYLKPVGRWGEETLPDAQNLKKILAELPSLQVSHVLDVRWPGATFSLPEDPPGLNLVFQCENQRVYRRD